MICSSVNLVRFIIRPQVGADSNRRWKKNPVAGHGHTDAHGQDWQRRNQHPQYGENESAREGFPPGAILR